MLYTNVINVDDEIPTCTYCGEKMEYAHTMDGGKMLINEKRNEV